MPAKPNLSKEEITELSQALSAAQTKVDRTERVRSYDFEHPDKLSRPNLRALQLIFAGLERPWSGILSTVLKTDVEVRAGQIEQTVLKNYAESLPGVCILGSFGMSPLPGTAIIQIPAELVSRIVNRMTGGKGEPPGEERRPTLVEMNILKRMLSRLCPGFSAAWSPVLSMDCTISETYRSMREIDVDEDEGVVVAGMTWAVGAVEYQISVGIFTSSLGLAQELLDPQRWIRVESGKADDGLSTMLDLLKPINIDLSVELGRARVSMEGLMSMEIGDVIRLDRAVSDPLQISLGGTPKFCGCVGVVGRRVSVQIQEPVMACNVQPQRLAAAG